MSHVSIIGGANVGLAIATIITKGGNTAAPVGRCAAMAGRISW
jgi:hypothetical protein